MSRSRSQSAYMRARKAGCRHPRVARVWCECDWRCRCDPDRNWYCVVCRVYLKHKPKAAEIVNK